MRTEFDIYVFSFINICTNIGFIPDILQFISNAFLIQNFAVIYLVVCLYFLYKFKFSQFSEKYFFYVYFKIFIAGFYYTIFGITFAALKFSVNLPRPFCSINKNQFFTIADIDAERCLSSFPSAHCGLSILVVYVLWPHMNKTIKIFSVIMVFVVSISRITMAMHYPLDLISSIFLTLIIIAICNLLFFKLKRILIYPIGKSILNNIFSKNIKNDH